MINYLRSENSRSKLQPTSSTASVSEFNKIAASSGLDQNNLNPSSFYSQELKFEIDEVQSPDNSIWESLLAEQIDLGADFLISSPMSSSVQAMHGQSLPGCSPPSCDSFHIDSLSTIHKERGQRPLHKIVNSPTNHFMQPESLALPTMDELMDEYHRDGFKGYPSMKKSDGGCSPEGFEMPTSLPAVLECLPLSDSLGFCGSVNEVETPGGSQNTQESEMQQMGSFAAAPLLEEQQQDQQEEENLDHGTLSTGSEQEHDDSNLQLVHLLLACADAVANEDYMSARQNLHHLKRVVTPLGNSIQRLASIFADALSTRLTAKVLTTNPNPASPKSFYPCPPYPVELLRTYQILYQTCPYLKFAHFTANQIIFEAIKAEERVHIIDLSIIQGYQWPAFMQALAARPGGAPFLRITGVGSPPEFVRETGRCLTELAQSLHVPFEFHPVSEQLEDLKPHMFQRRIGEALAVNSVHLLHKVNGKYLGNLLGMIRDQAPTIVALVEQDASHNGPYFMGRFLEALHYYSSLFDSLEATFPADSAQRAKVEKYLFGPQIQNIVGFEGPERIMRHERLEKWRKLMEGNGFKGVPLSANALTQAEMLLSLYPCGCAGYRLTQDKGCLLLGWQDRVLQAASAWRC